MPILLTILGFLWWWPLGLLMLGFFWFARGRFGYSRRARYAGDGPMLDWEHGCGHWEHKMARMQDKMDVMRAKMERGGFGRGWFGSASSGNAAFDDYRAETLRRLEDEQREFKDFLSRLRFAKDRQEFDQFMAERRNNPTGPEAPSEPPPAGPRD